MLQVADQYAFIPREAISKFLSYCTECQKKAPREREGSDVSLELSHSHVPATPPATPPSQQGSREKSPVRCEGGEEMEEEEGRHHINQQAAVHAMAYAQACHAMQTFISRGLPHPHPHTPHPHLHPHTPHPILPVSVSICLYTIPILFRG